jgi:uncharacterized membrane protein
MMRITLPKWMNLFIVLGIIGLISILTGYIFNTSICIFYNTTGVPSPSCGMTRAYKSLFRGDLSAAFKYHPLFILPPLLPLLFTKTIRKNKKLLNSLIALAMVILLGTWIVRLIVLFPDKDPFFFNQGALIPRLYNKIFK